MTGHFSSTTYGAEVLLVLTDSLHLGGVQDWHVVRHGLLSLLLVLFLLDKSINKTQESVSYPVFNSEWRFDVCPDIVLNMIQARGRGCFGVSVRNEVWRDFQFTNLPG